jgi:hypothetical protein
MSRTRSAIRFRSANASAVLKALAHLYSGRKTMAQSSDHGLEVEAVRQLLSNAASLVGECHALSYALVMALASTPSEALSRQEIDALCQVAYELHEKLTEAGRLISGLGEVEAGPVTSLYCAIDRSSVKATARSSHPAATLAHVCARRRRIPDNDSAGRSRTMAAYRVGLGRSPICSASTRKKPGLQRRQLAADRAAESSARRAQYI